MAFSGFSATPTVTEWNEVFTDLATRLNAADIESTERRAFCLPICPWDATTFDASLAESRRSVYFTAPMDKRMYAASIDAHVTTANAAITATLSPTVSDFLLSQGVSADNPQASMTPAGTGVQKESDLTLNGSSRPVRVRRGGQYKFVAAAGGTTAASSFGCAALFTTSGKRI